MQRYTTLLIAGAILCACTLGFWSAGGAQQKVVSSDPVADCNGDEAAKVLAGCTSLIKAGSLGPADLAIAHSRRSDAHLATGDMDAAIDDRGAALKLQPKDAGYQSRLAEAYRIRASAALMTGNHDKALADYGASIAVEASKADGYVGRSEVFLQRKEWDKAIADLKAATQLDDSHRARLSRAYESRGIAHLLKKDVDKAVADLSEAATLDPKNGTAFFHRGASHAVKGNVDGAIKDYSDSLRLEPENVEAYLRRGELYRELSSLSRAIADFDEAIKRDPKSVPALMLRALTREESGERDQATADYRVVLDIDPGNKLAKANLARLGAGSLPLPPERSAGVSDKAEPKVAALPKAATPGVGQFDGTWLIAATSETCKLRPDGSRAMTTTLRIANGVVHAATRVGAKVSGRVSHTGRMSGTLPSWADGQRVRFQGSIRGVAGAGTFSRSDGKCDGRFSMRRTGG